MEDQELKDPEKKAFFQTLPGIITGIATLITAVGGFLIILNKVGCMAPTSVSNKEQVEEQKSATSPATNDNTSIAKNKNSDEEKTEVNTQGKLTVTFSPADVKNYKLNIIFKIKEATIQTSGQDEFFHVKIKCLNESNTTYFFYPDYIRVKSGEDKYVPEQSSPSIDRQTISSQGFNNLEYDFKLPKELTEFQLLLFDDYSSADPIAFKVN